MKRQVKPLLYIVIATVLLGVIFGTIDLFRMKNDKRPLFTVEFKDRYWGLGYKIGKCTYYEVLEVVPYDLQKVMNCGGKEHYIFYLFWTIDFGARENCVKTLMNC